jgi:hypothetical protein
LSWVYNALVGQYQRRFSKRLQFMANYTLGKTVSDYARLNTFESTGTTGGAVSGFQFAHVYVRDELNEWAAVNTTYPSGSSQYPFGQVNGAREGHIGQLGAKLVF